MVLEFSWCFCFLATKPLRHSYSQMEEEPPPGERVVLLYVYIVVAQLITLLISGTFSLELYGCPSIGSLAETPPWLNEDILTFGLGRSLILDLVSMGYARPLGS